MPPTQRTAPLRSTDWTRTSQLHRLALFDQNLALSAIPEFVFIDVFDLYFVNNLVQ
jgi:hypothetical protein